MDIKKIAGATRTIGEAQGYLALPIRDEQVTDPVTGPGTPSMVTAWQPDDEERMRLAAGAAVILRVAGNQHPPVMINVGEDGEAESGAQHMAGPQLFYFSRTGRGQPPQPGVTWAPRLEGGLVEAVDIVDAWIKVEDLLRVNNDRASRADFRMVHVATATRSPDGFVAMTVRNPPGAPVKGH